MEKLAKLFAIISIFVFSLLLMLISLSSNSNAGCSTYSNSGLSPVNWIYYPDSAISVTDVNITRSDCGIMVTGTIKNRYPDVTLLAVYLDLNLFNNNSQLLGTINVDWERTLKPNQTVPFLTRYDSPVAASKLHHIYGQFDTSENKFLETDNKTLHTRDRCESLKETSKSVPNNGNDLSVEVLLKRLDQLGVRIDLNKLRLVR